MPKMKTHRAGAKRYKISASGKILRLKSGKKHLLAHKSQSRKRKLRRGRVLSKTQSKTIKRMINA